MTIDSGWVADLKRRISAASPAPWVVRREGELIAIDTGRSDGKRLFIKRDLEQAGDADVEFIATARNMLPRLVEAAVVKDASLLTVDEFEVIETALRNATPGPWIPHLEDVQPIGGCSVIWVGDEADEPDLYVWLEDEIAPSADIEFIASAREDVPRLMSELRYLRHHG
jgi:hypothetical protein